MAASLRAIRGVLMQDWDPCYVRDAPEAQDEYDTYVSQLYRMLRQGTSEKALVDYLFAVEKDGMGVTPQRTQLAPVAQKLIEIDVSRDEVFH